MRENSLLCSAEQGAGFTPSTPKALTTGGEPATPPAAFLRRDTPSPSAFKNFGASFQWERPREAAVPEQEVRAPDLE